ncbi:MAG: insulinase family protein [Pirellulales bacterium]|nr:insulinase family protein [Pirellulales bacterium]
MDWLDSAAFSLLVPAGSAYDPDDKPGLASLTCELALRGAGPRDSRQFVCDLDNLGVERAESVSDAHTSFSVATLAASLPKALAIYADVLREAHLPGDQLEASRQGVLQELRAVEDEPAHKVMLELRRNLYQSPWGRPSLGEVAALESATLADVQTQYRRLFRPNGAILGVAGRFDWDVLRAQVAELFGDWQPQSVELGPESQRPPRVVHIDHETNQTQIGVAYPSVPYRHPDYFEAWGAVGVLSGGMSARLFTEVREKRGLCYSVSASYHTYRNRGAVLCYAGTSAERAQETLDVLVGELVRLKAGVLAHELDRLKARIKSGLVMQQESSSARSGAVARDWYHLGRVRSMDEVATRVDQLSCESISAYLAANPPQAFTIVTLGPKALEVPCGI